MRGRTVPSIAMALAFAGTLLIADAAGAALAPGGTFADDDGNVHEANIEAIAAAGITVGCAPLTGDLFCPGRPVTRAEMAAFLIRSLGEAGNLPPYQGTFPDVPAGQWYTPFVERLAQLGITAGYTDGSYRPSAAVARSEMAAFLIRALNEAANLPSYQGIFTDVPAGHWYTPFVERLYQLGITSGCQAIPRRYCPFDAVTRDQMASFLARAFGHAPIVPPPRPSPSSVRLARQVVASGLDSPLFLSSPPGDARIFIVDQSGKIRVLEGGQLLPSPFLDISALVSFSGEQGLLGMAFHPSYATNGKFYVNYTNTAGDTRVVEYQVSAVPDVADPATARTLLSVDQPAANHNGGMLAFGPDGYMYIGLGDGGGGGDTFRNGQNPNTLLAKILRIDVNSGVPYGVPEGNPWKNGGGVPEMFMWGARNPWRFSFDGHRLYVADVGQGSWEEVDVLTTGDRGANLGWSIMEGSHCFRPATGCNQSGLVLPVIEYDHGEGCSITGGYVYRGSALPELNGHYFYGDYCSGWIRSFRFAGDLGGVDRFDWTGSLGTVPNLSSFGVDAAGELYVMSTNGTVWRIVRG